jgi:serine/threonine protein kinase
MAEGERSQPSLPKSIGRYQIQASLGAGAMGAVYKGFDPLIKRTLAIKTIRLDIPRASEEYKMFLERFYQEARISGTLSHPNIVTLFDIGEDNGLPFLALEFIEGDTGRGPARTGREVPSREGDRAHQPDRRGIGLCAFEGRDPP